MFATGQAWDPPLKFSVGRASLSLSRDHQRRPYVLSPPLLVLTQLLIPSHFAVCHPPERPRRSSCFLSISTPSFPHLSSSALPHLSQDGRESLRHLQRCESQEPLLLCPAPPLALPIATARRIATCPGASCTLDTTLDFFLVTAQRARG